jgi:hypothetical protein
MPTIIHQRLHLRFFPFKNRFYPAIRQIVHPTSHAVALGLPLRGLPKKDALHGAADVDVGSGFRHGFFCVDGGFNTLGATGQSKTPSLSPTPPLQRSVVSTGALKAVFANLRLWYAMFKGNSGKLMVYASTGAPSRKRLDSVRDAAKETAKRLNLDFEMVRFERSASPIYVYYEERDGKEPIPLYCDEGKRSDLGEISSALRNMMFVLSFHPKHTALRQMRSELLKLS